MYEEISLDAIESNRDEAPDYKSRLHEGSRGLGAPTGTDDRVYRVRQIASLEAEERSRYEEFARVAEREGLRNIAAVFKGILMEEAGHAMQLPRSQTAANLRTSVGREREKIEILKVMLSDARDEGDFALAGRLSRMVMEEEGHVRRLSDAIKLLESSPAPAPRATREEENFCEFGTCSPASKMEKVCEFGTCVPKSKNTGGRSSLEMD